MSAQTKEERARQKAALKAAQKLTEASEALDVFMTACRDCNDASQVRAADDGRLRLSRDINEYASWLESAFREKVTA